MKAQRGTTNKKEEEIKFKKCNKDTAINYHSKCKDLKCSNQKTQDE